MDVIIVNPWINSWAPKKLTGGLPGRKDQDIINDAEDFDGILNDCHFADIFFLLGKTEEGYRRLEKGIEARETWAATYGSLPSLKKFQQEPRFRELYKKIGHPLYVD